VNEESLVAYKTILQQMMTQFDKASISHISRNKNSSADALAKLHQQVA
jgi:hypothetical protein